MLSKWQEISIPDQTAHRLNVWRSPYKSKAYLHGKHIVLF
jgi:hypothetical protein